MIKEKNDDLKNFLTGLGVIFLYIILEGLSYDFISIFGVKYNDLSQTLKQVYLALYNSSVLALIIFIYRKDVIPNFKEFKKNIFSFFSKYIKYWFIMILLMIISNLIILNFTTANTSQNQQAIVNQMKLSPIYIFMLTIVIAPILEELVFRLSFRKIFSHTNILYIFFSGLFFGLMHVLGENSINILFIIPYSIPGFMFAYMHSKSKNICVPIMIHMIHNLIQVIIVLIQLF